MSGTSKRLTRHCAMLGRSGYMPTNARCPERRAGISQAAIRCNISKALSVCRLKAILLTLILPTRERKIERAPAQNTKTFLCRVEQMTDSVEKVANRNCPAGELKENADRIEILRSATLAGLMLCCSGEPFDRAPDSSPFAQATIRLDVFGMFGGRRRTRRRRFWTVATSRNSSAAPARPLSFNRVNRNCCFM
jgi:hypothetical protein